MTTNLETPAVFRSLRGKNLQVVSERTAAEKPDPQAEAELKAALATVRAAFAILGSRALVVLSLIASVGAFAWALYHDTALGMLGACLVTAMLFWPALWVDRTR